MPSTAFIITHFSKIFVSLDCIIMNTLLVILIISVRDLRMTEVQQAAKNSFIGNHGL